MASALPSDRELLSHPIGRLLARIYGNFPLRRALLSIIGRLEGGQLRSKTVRQILAQHHDVEVGAFSYGSLLVPGMADRKTRIGRYVSIGPDVRRLGAAHPMDALSLHPYWYNPRLGMATESQDVPRGSIVIDDDAWIGASAIILPGCHHIGVGAVIGAGAVVTHDVDDFAVVVGVPARQRSLRLSPDVRQALLADRPWSHPPEECRRRLTEIARQRA